MEVLSTRSEGQGAYPVCITDLLVTPSDHYLDPHHHFPPFRARVLALNPSYRTFLHLFISSPKNLQVDKFCLLQRLVTIQRSQRNYQHLIMLYFCCASLITSSKSSRGKTPLITIPFKTKIGVPLICKFSACC